MRIQALFNNVFKSKINTQNNVSVPQLSDSSNVKFAKLNNLNQDVFQKSQTITPDISFTGIKFNKIRTPKYKPISTASEFKNLVYNEPHNCIYCKRPMLHQRTLDEIKKSGVFSAPIRSYVQEMFSFISCMHPSETEFFKKVTMMSFDFPNIRLSEAIKKLYPEANKELLKEQLPIIKELAGMAQELPYGYKTKYLKLLRVAKYKLEDKPFIMDEFSGKEFSYKLKRVADTIKDPGIAKRILSLTEPLTHPIFKYPDEPLTKKFAARIIGLTERHDINPNTTNKKELQKLIIYKIRNYGAVLNRKDIINYCEIGLNALEGAPVHLKFSNKSFRYDLEEILENMPNEALKKRILDTTQKLPTTQTSVNAFITKHQYLASDAIGYNLLRPSIVTIEHMHPKSLGGPNDLHNYALACERCNNDRGNMPMEEFLQGFNPANQDFYFTQLYKDVFSGKLNRQTFMRMINTFEQESHHHINIDMNKCNKYYP